MAPVSSGWMDTNTLSPAIVGAVIGFGIVHFLGWRRVHRLTTHGTSPHANVKCVDCHIGPGAEWFVKAKISGSWQLVSVALDLYPTPIPTPIHNLRPARDTCEQCHWPTKHIGDLLRVKSVFQAL